MTAARILPFLLAFGLSAQLLGQDKHIVAGIVVEGNKRTKERIILRELTFHEGDTLTTDVLYERVERSRQNLMNTALFNTVVILPLYVPVLIFAAGSISRSLLAEGDPAGALLLLGGVDLGLLAITPWATAAALRQALR